MLRHFTRFNAVPEHSPLMKSGPGTKRSRKGWNWLFLVPFLGLLWPPLYAKTDPVLFGFPFFYWYQFAWVIVSAVLTGIIYLATQRRQSHD